MRLAKWAGWTTVVFGLMHMLAGAVIARQYVPGWLAREAWSFRPTGMTQTQAFWWLVPGSFGVPLVLLGIVVIWLSRRQVAPPQFLGWAVLIWVCFVAWTLEPSPGALGAIPAVLLILAARRSTAIVAR